MKNLNIFSLISEYDSAKSGGVLNKPNVSFVNEDSSVRYLVDIKIEYKYVDLGLPSGLKWATCNVGASSPEEYGLYFSWGETTGFTADHVENGECVFDPEKYTSPSVSENLNLEQDAAHVHMGGNWRMSTKAECQELIDNTTQTWTNDYNGTGVAGKVFTSKVNGNSVFFPAAGYCNDSSVRRVGSNGFYWSASWGSSTDAWGLDFNSGQHNLVKNYKFYGYTVRGVCE